MIAKIAKGGHSAKNQAEIITFTKGKEKEPFFKRILIDDDYSDIL
jgi:hypothetical protein